MGKYEYVDAFTTHESNLSTLYALVDLDVDAIREDPAITVTNDPDDADEIESVEYDISGPVPWNSVQSEFTQVLDDYAAEVTCGWGRPLEILLMGGGPTHWIEATYDGDGDIAKAILYATQEGPDHIDRQWHLSNHTALYRYAENFAQTNQMPKDNDEY